jgi:hypothetical protein
MTTPNVHRDARSAHLIAAGAQAVVENAKRLGIQWGMQPATVQQASTDNGYVLLVFDGDTTEIQAMSLVGKLLPGWRVMVMAVPPSANFVVGSFVQATGIVAYGSRPSNTPTTTTTELAVLSLSNVEVKAGVAYHIYSSAFIFDSSVLGDTVRATLRFTSDGTAPTTASVPLTASELNVTGGGNQCRTSLSKVYLPTTDQVLNIIMTIVRTAGTGSVDFQHNNGSDIDITVEAVGVAVTDAGVAL